MFEASIAHTGSEKFAPGLRFGTFPSFAAGWLASEESWFKEALPWVNYFKPRYSWGKVGSDAGISQMAVSIRVYHRLVEVSTSDTRYRVIPISRREIFQYSMQHGKRLSSRTSVLKWPSSRTRSPLMLMFSTSGVTKYSSDTPFCPFMGWCHQYLRGTSVKPKHMALK
jgi:hypothetical protein